YTSEPEKLYEYFKGYMMLVEPEHVEKAQLKYLMDLEWQASYGGDPDRLQSVTKHFQNLLDYSSPLRGSPADQRLIEQTRNRPRLASPAGLVYRNLRILYTNDGRHQALDLTTAAIGAEDVLQRRTRGATLKSPVPPIYTKPVFWEIAGTATDALV